MENFNNNDSLFSYILSHLVLNNKTKHILLPVMNIDININQFQDVISNFNEYTFFKEKLNDNKIHEIFSVRIRENFFKSELLCNYITSNQCDIKKLLFQVIHTLICLYKKNIIILEYNKLSPDNILIYLKKSTSDYDEYKYNDTTFYIKKYYL